jgi:hypothetical protein
LREVTGLPGLGTVWLVQVSLVLGVLLMVPVKITGTTGAEESPMAMHWAADGHVTCVIEEIGVVDTSGNSAASGPAGAPYRNNAPVVDAEVPTPAIRHFGVVPVTGQMIEDSEVTVVVVGL